MKEEGTYLVLKLGNKVYSTTFFHKVKHVFDFRRSEEKENIWIKGEFTEKKGHKQMKPLPFEVNIYIRDGSDKDE